MTRLSEVDKGRGVLLNNRVYINSEIEGDPRLYVTDVLTGRITRVKDQDIQEEINAVPPSTPTPLP